MYNKTGCLLIHGFGGDPSDVEPLADFLHQKGILVLCPTLKGHTGKRRDLRGVSYRQWIQSAEEGLKALSNQCDNLVLIGFSMGGLISVSLPHSNQVRGIVLLNTPIYPWNLKQIGLNIITDLRKRSYEHIRYYTSSIKKIPISATIEFLKFLNTAKHNFKQQKYPLFIGQALADDTVQPRSAEYIYHSCPIADKSLYYYGTSNHLICHSKAAPELFKDILMFIENCCVRNL
ncbi:MAG TPA: alpha/beta fold hydrolase [Clostridiales bacterium]|nr:alpha/beta fold hydrolase [Clostridiales bacterium]